MVAIDSLLLLISLSLLLFINLFIYFNNDRAFFTNVLWIYSNVQLFELCIAAHKHMLIW